jgi:hypothetical protein
MAYGNKFIKTQGRKDVRVQVTSPSGTVYSIDPWMESTQMMPWELTEAIRYFLDLKLAPRKKQPKPNRFVHVQR